MAVPGSDVCQGWVASEFLEAAAEDLRIEGEERSSVVRRNGGRECVDLVVVSPLGNTSSSSRSAGCPCRVHDLDISGLGTACSGVGVCDFVARGAFQTQG